MEAAVILSQATSEGLKIALTSNGNLNVIGRKTIYEKWIKKLKFNKIQIVNYIRIQNSKTGVINSESNQLIPDLLSLGVHEADAYKIQTRIYSRNLDSSDDRIICYECTNLKGSSRSWLCGNALASGLSILRNQIQIGDLVNMFQRCHGFKPV